MGRWRLAAARWRAALILKRLIRQCKNKTVTIDVSETELVFHCDDGIRTVRRTNNRPVTRIKAHRPRKTCDDEGIMVA